MNRSILVSRKGMTLMELVIGLAITGMMATAGAAAFGAIIDHRREIRTSTVSTERAAALREMLRSWIYAGTVQIQQGGGPRGLTRGAAAPSAPGTAATAAGFGASSSFSGTLTTAMVWSPRALSFTPAGSFTSLM